MIKGNRGFTMVEVIAVLIIIGIIAAVAVSRLISSQENLIAEFNTAKAHLRFAQLKALSDDDPTISGWGISFAGNSYTLTKDGAPAAISLPGSNSNTYNFPGGITATAINVVFDSWGSAGTTPATITMTYGANTETINITEHTGYIP